LYLVKHPILDEKNRLVSDKLSEASFPPPLLTFAPEKDGTKILRRRLALQAIVHALAHPNPLASLSGNARHENEQLKNVLTTRTQPLAS
jgi:hypothetical protein